MMNKKIIVLLLIVVCLLTACSTSLLASSETSKANDANLEWAFTSTVQHPEKVLISSINEAKSTLDVAIYSLTHPEIVDAIKRAENRGVHVRMIVDHQQSQGKAMTEALKLLGSSGIEMKQNTHSGLMHLKMVVIDNQIATTGSFNFSKAAATTNDEILMIIRNPDVARSFASEFQDMWTNNKKFETITPIIASATQSTISSVSGEKVETCSVKSVKGNPDSKIYHMPGQKHYDSLSHPVLFCSEQAAKNAGYRKSKV